MNLRAAAEDALRPYGLHVGIGVNAGPVIEGMIGTPKEVVALLKQAIADAKQKPAEAKPAGQ